MLVHVWNVILASYMVKSSADHDACSWFFINVVMDSTFGLIIIYVLLRLSSKVIYQQRWTLLYSGEYGNPPQPKVSRGPLCPFFFPLSIRHSHFFPCCAAVAGAKRALLHCGFD